MNDNLVVECVLWYHQNNIYPLKTQPVLKSKQAGLSSCEAVFKLLDFYLMFVLDNHFIEIFLIPGWTVWTTTSGPTVVVFDPLSMHFSLFPPCHLNADKRICFSMKLSLLQKHLCNYVQLWFHWFNCKLFMIYYILGLAYSHIRALFKTTNVDFFLRKSKMLNSASTPNLKETFCCAAEVGGEMAPSGGTGKSACLLRLKMGGSEKSGWAVQENKDELFRKRKKIPNACKYLLSLSSPSEFPSLYPWFVEDVSQGIYEKEFMARMMMWGGGFLNQEYEVACWKHLSDIFSWISRNFPSMFSF